MKFFLPLTEDQLTSEVNKQLLLPVNDGVFQNVNVKFQGQEATLRGFVATQEEKNIAEKITADKVRLIDQTGENLNPVIEVHNEILVDADKAPARARPWMIISIFGGNKRVDGCLKSVDQRIQILTTIEAKTPKGAMKEQVMIDGKSLPVTDFDSTVKNVPSFADVAVDHKAIAVTTCDGKWTLFPGNATDAEIITALAPSKIQPNEINNALAESRASGTVESPALQVEPVVEMPVSQPNGAYLIYGGSGSTISLGGIVASEQDKNNATELVKKAYPAYTVDGEKIQIDVQRKADPSLAPSFLSAPKEAFIGFSPYGAAPKIYGIDAFDSEIATDFPDIKFADNEITNELADFRNSLANAGTLKRDDPYLSMITDGKKLTLSGEVADVETKQRVFDSVKLANPTLEINDKLVVTLLVNKVKNLQPTLDGTVKFTPDQSGVAVSTPGATWRSAVVHSIYFQTGLNRSKDQERAIKQMRKVLELLPSAKFEIVGHTDNVGEVKANTALSQSRAESFIKYAGMAKFDAGLLSARGAGPTEPLAINDTNEGKALNRRVDVMLK
jgi:outer membrane protein OmpA-like peptidoglycan-associated protein